MLNEYYQNIGIKGFLKRYGIYNAVIRGVFSVCPIHIVKDYELKKLLWQQKVAKQLKKYYKYEDIMPDGLSFPDVQIENPVWLYWEQGMDNAPDIVKACYRSIQKYACGTIEVVTGNNINNYIKMPDYVEQKRKSGNLTIAHYTDLLRYALLEHYGGTWIDATVFLTEEVPSEVRNCDFFALHNSMGLIENPALYPVWFIHAKKGNILVRKIRNVEFAYWQHENHVKEYLISNLIMTNIIHKNPKEEKKIPYMANDSSEYLVRVLGDTFSESRWEWIKKIAGIHKLTYKLNPEIGRDGTFYRMLIDWSQL